MRSDENSGYIFISAPLVTISGSTLFSWFVGGGKTEVETRRKAFRAEAINGVTAYLELRR